MTQQTPLQLCNCVRQPRAQLLTRSLYFCRWLVPCLCGSVPVQAAGRVQVWNTEKWLPRARSCHSKEQKVRL